MIEGPGQRKALADLEAPLSRETGRREVLIKRGHAGW
jgi:hypothetical protein